MYNVAKSVFGKMMKVSIICMPTVYKPDAKRLLVKLSTDVKLGSMNIVILVK